MARRRAAAIPSMRASQSAATDPAPRVPRLSWKVRTILKLEACARGLLARYEGALAAATQAKAEAYLLLDQVDERERALSCTELGELRRARAHAAAHATTSSSTAPDPAAATTPTDGGSA